MEAYLSDNDAVERIGGLQGTPPSDLDLRLASDTVDASGPFYGEREDRDQEREFPRTWTRPGDVEGEVPGSILDAVCLLAWHNASGDTEAPVKSESVLDASVTYATAARLPVFGKLDTLLAPYRQKSGRRL